jgi:hypothetical protein
VNWFPLLLAAVFGALGAALLVRHKAPRAAAIFIALGALALLAGIPSLLAMIGHPLAPGWVLLGVVVATIFAAIFFYLDIIRGEHKNPLGRKGGGGAGTPGGGSGKPNHHVRPLVVCLSLMVFGLMTATNFGTIASGTGHGFTQTWSTIAHTN